MRMRFGMAALLAGLISVPALAAGVYKWVDVQGGIHYSDTAQPGWRRVDVNPTIVDADAPPKSADAGGAGKSAAECQQKRATLAGYKASSRIVERNSLGVEHEYTPEEKQKLIAMAEQQLAGCPPADDEPAESDDSDDAPAQ